MDDVRFQKDYGGFGNFVNHLFYSTNERMNSIGEDAYCAELEIKISNI